MLNNCYNIKFKFIILLIIISLSVTAVTAHQPRIELGLNNTKTEPLIV
jgi:hypothetical protein